MHKVKLFTVRDISIRMVLSALVICLCSGSILNARDRTEPQSAPVILSGHERAWLQAHPVIRVVQDVGWPPVEYVDSEGKQQGISADYLALIEKRLGIRFKRVRTKSWQAAYKKLQKHELDMTISVAVTPERLGFWTFTRPYMNIPIVIASTLDVTYLDDMNELTGKHVSVVDGYAVCDWIPRDYPAIKLVRVASTEEGLQLVHRGEVFAHIDNMLVIGYYLARMKLTNIKIAGKTPYINAQCMAVRNDWPELAGIVQKGLNSISPSEKAGIYRKWVPIRFEEGTDYTMLLRAVLVFIAVVAGLGLWIGMLFKEITERKRAEMKVRELLSEKELLLKEAHHRVKNNMSTVISMLSLQAEMGVKTTAAEAVRDTRDRLQAMWLLYDKLYNPESFRNISVLYFVPSLMKEILNIFPEGRNVAVETKIDDFILDVRTASSLGIIINELLTNAMKHAFAGRQGGVIVFSAKKEGNHVTVGISDNGPGMPEGADDESEGFGIQLVRMLVVQIGGTISITRNQGTHFIIEFDTTGSEQQKDIRAKE